MDSIANKSPHHFHIPVMGTGFTIDTPLRVAKYGISSVVSLSDDVLLEQMRKFHCQNFGMQYTQIPDSDKNARANRVTAYLDLLDELVSRQVKQLQSSPFEPGSEITRYFDLIPDSPSKELYHDMLVESDPVKKSEMQRSLRSQVQPGGIDVNIMTKLDRDIYRNGEKLPAEYADAMSALRGFAEST
ncbi:MAG: hypothetical protein P1R58_06360, partial [bacterium]|nr:hypothetical protein [bacterium]